MESTVKQKAEELSVTADLDKRVSFMSPGGRRKLSIAMALIGEARLVILDEPTSNLDLHSRKKIWHLIRKIASKERAILISTQHIEEAEHIGTRVCILKDGINFKCDTPDNLKRCFGSGFKLQITATATKT